jgi:uncharacterized membrane protein
MKLRILAALAASLALALGPVPAAWAQKEPSPGGSQQITIRVCNNTNVNARVALSYQPLGASQFINEGWFSVQARSCQDLVNTANGYFYTYAEVEGDSTRYWNGNYPLCVEYPGPYEFWSVGHTSCDSRQVLQYFIEVHTDQWGVYTWSLDPAA